MLSIFYSSDNFGPRGWKPHSYPDSNRGFEVLSLYYHLPLPVILIAQANFDGGDFWNFEGIFTTKPFS